MHRMVAAFEALSQTRARIGPAGFGSGWPQYVHDWQDQLAQEEPAPGETQSEGEKRRRGDVKPLVLPPTREQISLMEEAFDWPLKFLSEHADLSRLALNWWAFLTSRDRDVGTGLANTAFAEAKVIAAGLTRENRAVR